MKVGKINNKSVRQAAKKKGIRNFAELAKLVPCSRPAVFFAIERPSRFPIVYARIREIVKI